MTHKKLNSDSVNELTKSMGCIQLYTGNGKGKTTAALGLAVRAVGARKRVFIAQFVKGIHYSELNVLNRFPEIDLIQYGLECFIVNKPTENDIVAARNGFKEVSLIISQNNFDMVILDELCIALYYKLIEIEEVIKLLNTKPKEMEIIITGRYAPQELYEISDLITEMTEIKHYYQNGINARMGIEY